MRITLTDNEAREALRHTISVKTKGMYGCLNEDDCYFEISNSAGDVEDIESVEFIGVYNLTPPDKE